MFEVKLSDREKVEAVKMLNGSCHTVRDAYDAPGISRSSYYYGFKERKFEGRWEDDVKDQEIHRKMRAIKAGHPFWGCRRLWAWLG